MAVEWMVREFRPEDLPALYDLTVLSFANDPNTRPVEVPYAHFEWMFLQCPHGEGCRYVAVVGDKIVGTHGTIPIKMYYRQQEILGSLSIWAMAHPDYRRQGMFETLGRRVYDRLGEMGIPLTHAFPNPNSYHGFIHKLGWLDIATLDMYVRPIDLKAVVGKVIRIPPIPQIVGAALSPFFRVKAPADGDFRLCAIYRFDSRADALIEARSKAHEVIVKRDAAYLNWRYIDSPYWKYHVIAAETDSELLGYVVVRCLEAFGLTGGMIMDIAALPGRADVLDALAKHAVVYSAEQGMDVSVAMVQGSIETLDALRHAGFMRVPRKLGMKTWHFGVHCNNNTVDPAFVGDIRNWFVVFGDDDVM